MVLSAKWGIMMVLWWIWNQKLLARTVNSKSSWSARSAQLNMRPTHELCATRFGCKSLALRLEMRNNVGNFEVRTTREERAETTGDEMVCKVGKVGFSHL